MRMVFTVMLAVFTVTAAAHHSIAMFDNLNPTTLTGTVKEFIRANPHGHLVIDVNYKKAPPNDQIREFACPELFLSTPIPK